MGKGGREQGAVGAPGLRDREGEDVGDGNRLAAKDVGEDRRLAPQLAVEGQDLALRWERGLLWDPHVGREAPFTDLGRPAGKQGLLGG